MKHTNNIIRCVILLKINTISETGIQYVKLKNIEANHKKTSLTY